MKYKISKDKKTLILIADTNGEADLLDYQLNYVPGFYFLWRYDEEKEMPESPLLKSIVEKSDKIPVAIGIMHDEDGFYKREEKGLIFDARLKEDKRLIEELKLNKLFKGLL